MSPMALIGDAPYYSENAGAIATVPRMPEQPPDTDDPTSARSGRAAVIYWLVAGAIYIGLGMAYPPAFLLGFQESILFVLIVTALAPRILGRFK